MLKSGARYLRHTLLSEIGIEGQEAISRARILIIGTGGLGCPAIQYLALAGVSELGVVDADIVSDTNLQRQVLFTEADIGRQKAVVAAEVICHLNPQVKSRAYTEFLTTQNAPELFASYDLIIDGTDNFESKFLVGDAGVKFSRPVVYGAISGFEAQVGIFFNATNSPCYRCLIPKEPKTMVRNCATIGVLGSVAGIAGTMQATLALQYLISKPVEPSATPHPLTPNDGEIFVLNMRGGWTTSSFKTSKRSGCVTCGVENPASITLHGALWNCTSSKTSSKNTVFLDVREASDRLLGKIPNAVHMPLSRFNDEAALDTLLDSLKPGSQIVCYCKSGEQSSRAVRILRELCEYREFKTISVFNLAGGFDAWSKIDQFQK